MTRAMAMATAVIIALTALAGGVVLCEDTYTSDDLRTFGGKVTAVDIPGATISVNSGTTKIFSITSDTTLTKGGSEVELSGIGVNDYVVVGYYEKGGMPGKVLTVRVEYGSGDEIW